MIGLEAEMCFHRCGQDVLWCCCGSVSGAAGMLGCFNADRYKGIQRSSSVLLVPTKGCLPEDLNRVVLYRPKS